MANFSDLSLLNLLKEKYMAEEEKVESAPAPGGRSPLVALMLIVNAGLIAVVGFMQYKAHLREQARPCIIDVVKAQMKELTDETEEDPEGEEILNREEQGLLLPLEGFTANLAQGDGPRRYVRINMVLKFSSDSQESEFKAKTPQIRDSVISLLNAKRPEDLLRKEGKNYLKEEIKASINTFLIDGNVIDVYYVGFQIN